MLSRHGGRPAAWVMLIVGFGVLGALGVLRGRAPADDTAAGAGAAPEAISVPAIPAPLPGDSATGAAPTGELTISNRPGTASAVPARAPVGASGVPGVPLAAYQRAERILASTAPGCRLRWSLLAAVGRAESGHANGGRVDAAGRTLGRILGPSLDGTNGRPRVPDTDGGALDGDRKWDRAVGPMQLLPSVWRRYATAEDGRTAPDPDNVFDAALTAGRFLCAGGADLGLPDRQAEAIRRYRDSPSYLAAVRAWSAGYADGDPSVPLVTPGPRPPTRPPLAAPPSSGTRRPSAVPRPLSSSSVSAPRPRVRPPGALPTSAPARPPGPTTPRPPTPTGGRSGWPTTTDGPTRAGPRPDSDRSTGSSQSADGAETDRSPSQRPTPSRQPPGSRESRSERPPSARATPSSSPSSPTRTPAGPPGSAAPTTPHEDRPGPIIVVEPTTTPAAPGSSPRSTEAPGPTGLAVPPPAGPRAPGSDPSGSAAPGTPLR